MRLIVRSCLYLAAFIVPIMLTGGVGMLTSMRAAMPLPADDRGALINPPPAPRHAATKPTVVVVLGNAWSEVTDVLGPYAIFAESGLYNVYTVAETRTLHRLLPGGLDLVPHLSFAELDARLGRSPDIVVVPAMTSIDAAENQPVLDWIRQQAQGDTLLFSWCAGAEVLAAAGLLDGKAATTHWGDIGWLARAYPAVQWQHGVRYVDAGTVLTSAGLTAGFDATLHVLAQRHGQDVAEQVARALHYPSLDFVTAPTVEQYQIALPDSIYLLNSAFYWAKRDAGVWLYDGVGDLELAAVFDVYPFSGTTRTVTVADAQRLVTSQYGLQLVPRWDVSTLPPVDRLLVPGGASAAHTHASLTAVAERLAAPLTHVHDPARPRFAFEAPLEDLAREHNVPTAAFAAKRLEYRAPSLQLDGPGWPVLLTLQPVFIGGVSVGLVLWLMRRRDRHRQQGRIHRPHPTPVAPPA